MSIENKTPYREGDPVTPLLDELRRLQEENKTLAVREAHQDPNRRLASLKVNASIVGISMFFLTLASGLSIATWGALRKSTELFALGSVTAAASAIVLVGIVSNFAGC